MVSIELDQFKIHYDFVENVVQLWVETIDPDGFILICLILGLCKIGVEVAFLNFNLRNKSLLHCIKISDAKLLIVGSGQSCRIYIINDGSEFSRWVGRSFYQKLSN